MQRNKICDEKERRQDKENDVPMEFESNNVPEEPVKHEEQKRAKLNADNLS